MVKVTIKPWEEIIVHESIQYAFDDFIKLCGMGVQPGGLANALQWAEGIVFRFIPMPPTDEVVKEQLAGRIHWSARVGIDAKIPTSHNDRRHKRKNPYNQCNCYSDW
jgi:hypothetical protein